MRFLSNVVLAMVVSTASVKGDNGVTPTSLVTSDVPNDPKDHPKLERKPRLRLRARWDPLMESELEKDMRMNSRQALAVSPTPPSSPSEVPSNEPTEVRKDLLSGVPSSMNVSISSTMSANIPTADPVPQHYSQSSTPPSDRPIVSSYPSSTPTSTPTNSPSKVPECDFTRKVGFKCGKDTIVCNPEPFAPATEVCELQPIQDGGKLYIWSDSVSDATAPCNIEEENCWCQHMSNGVTTPSPQVQALFPGDIRCPNGEYVDSYVCYFPVRGGRHFLVERFDDDNDGSWTTMCTAFQRRDELPVMLSYQVDMSTSAPTISHSSVLNKTRISS